MLGGVPRHPPLCFAWYGTGIGTDLVPAQLYLDTARLGLMSPSAQLAQISFAQFAGEAAGSLYFDKLLADGFQDWPASYQRRYPGLFSWGGLSQIKAGIRRLTGATQSSPVLLANRSSELMRLTARLMFAECRTVLTTDLSWPNYQRILGNEARRKGARLVCLKLRRRILVDNISAKEVVDRIEAAAVREHCQGLFVPIVDNLGIALPMRDIASRLRLSRRIRFLAIDGAQALGHIPMGIRSLGCDVFLAGCHKWVRAYNPLGLALLSNPESQAKLSAFARRAVATRVIDDPLQRMLMELDVGSPSRYGETVNLLPLFTCAGALRDLLRGGCDMASVLTRRLQNADCFRTFVDFDAWRIVSPAQEMRSGICLVATHAASHASAAELRRRFHEAGIAVTTYPHGYVRLSMPGEPWIASQERVLRCAFSHQPVWAK